MLRLNLGKHKPDFPASQPESAERARVEGQNNAGFEASALKSGNTDEHLSSDKQVTKVTPISPPIERDQQLERLMQYWHAAENRQGKIVLLSGEAGYGKSMLADSFLRAVQAEGKQVKLARTRCSSQSGRDEAFWPFADVISQLAAGKQSKTVAGDILDAVLELAPSWVSVIPVAGTVIGASITTAQVVRNRSRTNDMPNPDKLLREYVGALQKVADKSPVVIFIDDMHWSDAGSIKLLSHLSRSIDSMRVLVLVAYRPSDIAVEGHPLYALIKELLRYDTETEITVPPLTLEGTAALLQRNYPANKFPATLAQTLFTSTGGSPFFIVESLRLMQSSEHIMRDSQDGKWTLVRDINEDDLPRSVEAVVHKRMERMPKGLHEALAMAAVEGLTFETAVLAHALGINELAVMKLLEPAEKLHDIIDYAGDVELSEDITSRFRFTSRIIQRELMETMRGKQRLLAHRKTAEGLESMWGEGSEDLAPKLADHFERGKVFDKAGFYHVKAGKRGRATGVVTQAMRHFETAELLYAKCSKIPPEMQFEIDENLSYLYELDSDYEKSEARTRNALAAGYDKLGWQRYALLQIRLAQLSDNAGRFNDALDILNSLHDLLKTASEEDNNSEQAYHLHAELAQALTRVSRADEGSAYAEEALGRLMKQPQTEDARRLRLHLMVALTDSHQAQGNYKQVCNLLKDVVVRALELHVIDTQAEALANLAEVYVILGQFDQMQEALANLTSLASQMSSESSLAAVALVTARALIEQGKHAESLAHLDELDRLIKLTHYTAIRPQALSLRAIAYINLDRAKEVLPILDQARSLAIASGSREAVAYVDAIQAMHELTQREETKALELAQGALQVFKEENTRYEQAYTLRVIAWIYRAQGQLTQSRKAFEDAQTIYTSITNTFMVKLTQDESEL